MGHGYDNNSKNNPAEQERTQKQWRIPLKKKGVKPIEATGKVSINSRPLSPPLEIANRSNGSDRRSNTNQDEEFSSAAEDPFEDFDAKENNMFNGFSGFNTFVNQPPKRDLFQDSLFGLRPGDTVVNNERSRAYEAQQTSTSNKLTTVFFVVFHFGSCLTHFG